MIIVLVLVYVLVLIRTAWVSDDAYITFRTIDNFVNGYGLRWNVAERVQSYTHPLWMFLMTFAYLLTGELYFTSIFLSLGVSLATAVLLVYAVAQSSRSASLALVVLILSKAFTDYSTSGLENPLTHLLLSLFALVYYRFENSRRTLLLLSLIAALGTLNRLDTVLLYLPALVYTSYRLRTWKVLGPIAIGFTPLILWEGFAFFYYGFFVPNTAFAKLGAGIPRSEMVSQGLAYLLNSITVDPLTMLAIAGAVAMVVVRKTGRHIPMLAGALLFLVYVVYVGGDFMTGRFLTGPLLLCAIVTSRFELPNSYTGMLAPLAVVLVLGLSSPYCPIYSDSGYGRDGNPAVVVWQGNGVADERGHYYQDTGLLKWTRGLRMPQVARMRLGEAWKNGDSGSVVVGWANGFAGFGAGPGIYIIDPWALSDPLLARLPAVKRTLWRVGHADRMLPEGYKETVETGQNAIADSGLAAYYDRLSVITRGRLLSWARIKTAIRMNLGYYDRLLPSTTAPPLRIPPENVSVVVAQGSPWIGEGATRLDPAGAQIDFDSRIKNRMFEIALDHNDEYLLVFMVGDDSVASIVVPPANMPTGGMAIHLLDVPEGVAVTGFDALRIYPLSGDNFYSVGHLRFGENETAMDPAPAPKP